MTLGELQYVIGNVLRSSRYGAMSSRLGRVRNNLIALIFSDTEIFSNLELTQQVYDLLKGSQDELDFPLRDHDVNVQTHEAITKLLARVIGREPFIVKGEALEQVIAETRSLYRNPDDVRALLEVVDQGYQAQKRKK